MDVNLTGQIAATLAENIKSPNPIITIAASALGGFITGMITLLAIKITNDKAKERDETNRKHEIKVKAYLDLLDELYLLIADMQELSSLSKFNSLKNNHIKEFYFIVIPRCLHRG